MFTESITIDDRVILHFWHKFTESGPLTPHSEFNNEHHLE